MEGPQEQKPEAADSVQKLEKKLYQAGDSYDFNAHRARLSGRPSSLSKINTVAVGNAVSTPSMPDTPKKSSWIKYFLLGSVAFFTLASIFAVLFFGQGANSVSADNIEMSVNGPVSVKGGEPLDLQLMVTNNNAVALEFVDLTVEFPEGSRDPKDQTKELTRRRESIGTIAPGESVSKIIEGVLLGEDNAQKEILFKLDYRFGGSNIIAVKSKPYQVTLSSSPVSIALSAPSEVTSNQDVQLVITTTSNALTPLKNMLLEVKYPPGFVLKSSVPEVYSGTSVWNLGTLEPGKSKSVTLKGTIDGQEDELKAFRATAGSESTAEGVIGVPFGTLSRTLAVRRPALAATIYINGSTEKEVAATAGASFGGTLILSNNLTVPISRARVEVQLGGKALNRTSVKALKAFFDSRNNLLFWDVSTDDALAVIDPGEALEYSFDIAALPLVGSQEILTNATVDLDFHITGTRTLPSGGNEEVVTVISRKVKLVTGIELLPRITFYTGPFQNMGTLPPRAEKETTYTVTWSIANSSNDVSKAEVRAKLPPYVRFLDKVSPLSEDIRFDLETREVVWTPGLVKAGSGYKSAVREAAFQVAFTPGLGQVGSEPELIGEVRLSGHDNFTNTEIMSIKKPLTTVLTNEPRFRSGDGMVIK